VNIYDEYPHSVECNGRVYAVNLSYDRVLRCFDIQADDVMTQEDKIIAQAGLLIEKPPRSLTGCAAVLAAIYELFPKDETQKREKLIDFHQDARMIRSGFMRIGIDLTRNHIHFFQFLELLADLPKDTAIMRTVEIRAKPIPAANKHNQEYIRQLQEAKARVAIKMTDAERRDVFMAALKNSTIGRG
jgi:hypothetical protein